ncbi:hypothetical protein ACDY96_31815 [Rhizobium mongolense]|uniref:hypothetical protein n=1 Tax=Rhizobium mongolense TaxID=57676 RepID=UPI0035585D31
MSLSVAILGVGIDNYPEHFYREGERPLRCAVRSTKLLSQYARRCWPTPDQRRSRFLFNQNATRESILKASAELAFGRSENNPYELFIAYFCGHGRSNGNQAWFCPWSAIGEEAAFDGSAFNELLNVIPAERTLVLLDCCHSAAVLEVCNFFQSLPPRARSRLYVASSRPEQLSWEHDSLGRTILAHAFFDIGLSPPPTTASPTTKNFDAQLFPVVSHEVARLARNLKGAPQEAVRGGVSSAGLDLPLFPRRDSRQPSAAQLIWLRRWQLTFAGAAIALFLVGAIELFAFHIAPTARGYVGIWSGIKELRFLFPDEEWALKVETPFKMDDIYPGDKLAVSSGDVTGLWFPIEGSARAWYRVIGDILDVYQRSLWAVKQGLPYRTEDDAHGGGIHPVLDNDALAKGLLIGAEIEKGLLTEDGWESAAAQFDWCTTPESDAMAALDDLANQADPFFPNRLPEIIRDRADIAILLAQGGDQFQFGTLLNLIGIASVRGIGSGQLPIAERELPLKEADSAARLAEAILVGAKTLERQPLSNVQLKQLESLSATRCRAVATLVLSALAIDNDKQIKKQLDILNQPDFNDELTLNHLVALRGLQRLAMASQLPDEGFELVRAKILSTKQGQSEWINWLLPIADQSHMPDRIIESLLQQVEASDALPELGLKPELSALQRNVSFLSKDQLDRLEAVFRRYWDQVEAEQSARPPDGAFTFRPERRQAASRRYQSAIIGWGWLGSVGRIPNEVFDRLKAGSQELTSSQQNGIALARIAQHQELEDGLDVLTVYAITFPNLPEVRELYRGIAWQRSKKKGPISYVEVLAAVGTLPKDAAFRALEVEVASEQIRLLPTQERLQLVGDLQSAWKREREPEIKTALADIILRSRLSLTNRDFKN